jgi:hypothetical protein
METFCTRTLCKWPDCGRYYIIFTRICQYNGIKLVYFFGKVNCVAVQQSHLTNQPVSGTI